jgi:uncharacterized protein YfiM (DUF2279 family)
MRSIVLAALALSVDPAPDLRSLEWMAGSWTGTEGAVEMEEVWTAPKAGSMLGLHRDTSAGQTVSFEFLRIEATASGITHWASPKGPVPVSWSRRTAWGRRSSWRVAASRREVFPRFAS